MLTEFDIQKLGFYLSHLVLLVLIVISSYTDLKFRKIYNRHTIPSLLVGMFLATLVNFPGGLWNAILASLVAFTVFFVMFALGIMGGGDVKLVAAVGALIGYPCILDALFWGIMCGGVYAILSLLKRKALVSTLKQIFIFIWNLFIWRIVTPPNLKESKKIPYGLCIASGTIIALVMKYMNYSI